MLKHFASLRTLRLTPKAQAHSFILTRSRKVRKERNFLIFRRGLMVKFQGRFVCFSLLDFFTGDKSKKNIRKI